MTDLIDRIGQADPENFPFTDVVAEFRRFGKHFVPKELLMALDAARRRLSSGRDGCPAAPAAAEVARFLDCALDKWDGRYDYSTYTGLALLPMPGGHDPAAAARAHDRLLLLLVTDTLRFELAAAAGQVTLLPRMRPGPQLLAKRCRLGLRVLGAQLGTLRLTPADVGTDPCDAARRGWQAVAPGISDSEQRMLSLSMLPVDIIHDEYMFIRVLQSFEATFALLIVQLEAAIRMLAGLSSHGAGSTADTDARETAGQLMRVAAAALHEAAPLFSLLATMQVSAFRLFRHFTEGASAIQSGRYKIMEALCRRPDPERLDSPAYRSVPEVRRMVLAGQSDLASAVSRARAAGALPPDASRELAAAMDSFADALSQWRTTHYRLAVRMLGTAPGTGYTEGTPYLKSVMGIPIFPASASNGGDTQ
jgi:tryptophan 2,3-dioxygenase